MKIFDCFSPFKNDVKEVINGLSGGPKVQSWTDKSVRVVDLNDLPPDLYISKIPLSHSPIYNRHQKPP